MSASTTLFAANWKMNKTRVEAAATASDLAARLNDFHAGEVLLIPGFTCLEAARSAIAGVPAFSLGAQDVYPAEKGAFTGEVAPGQLLDAGCAYVLTGHSERRHVLGEADEFVGRKTAFAAAAGLKPILCVGETLPERQGGRLEEVLTRQLATGCAEISSSEGLAIAYEPVWAIGTGVTATIQDIVQAHAFVRGWLASRFGANGDSVRILYGGSVTPKNARDILAVDNVNGVLVGGASLDAESFAAICLA